MGRLILWVLVVSTAMVIVPFMIARASVGDLLVVAVIAAAGLYGRHLRRHHSG